MYVIVGLGNPSRKYEGTRHNIGFEIVEYLAYRNNIKINKIKHQALVGEGIISGSKVMLVKPQTYMNLSGRSVKEIFEYYDLESENIIVIYDDIDIELGRIRLRKKGSAGTHNGMRSIIYEIQTENFPRVRIGIGKPEKGDLAKYVLGRFDEFQKESIINAIKESAEAVEAIVNSGIEKAMNDYNK